jgi:hypothetical protein
MGDTDLTCIETSITSLRDHEESWEIETLSAIKFKLYKKWKIRPFPGQDIKLYIAKGGRIHTVFISQRLIKIYSDTADD